jgi:prepilin-type N-terminal cleavage/methylation domain-containing protein
MRLSRPAGFTLLEVVLAMTALALIVAICYGAFHLAIRAIERGEVAVTTAQRLRATTDVLRQIRSAVNRKVCRLSDDPEPIPCFFGDATSLEFDTNMRLQGGGGASHVRYEVLDNPMRFVVTESELASTRHRTDVAGRGMATVLLEGFRKLGFHYFDMDECLPPVGCDRWPPESDIGSIPLAVQIEIEGVPGLESGRWGETFPVEFVALNEVVGAGVDDVDDRLGDGDDEDLDDEDDDGVSAPSSRSSFPPKPPRGRSYTDEDLED